MLVDLDENTEQGTVRDNANEGGWVNPQPEYGEYQEPAEVD